MNDKPPLSGSEARADLERRLGAPLEELALFPRWYQIETINICNAKCIMCGLDWKTRPRTVMDPGLFARIAAQIGAHSDTVRKVGLYWGGEPLLDRSIHQRIAIMKAAGVNWVYLASNGSRLDAEVARRLMEAGLDEIYLSVDSLIKDRYESIRRALRFEMVLENVLGLARLRDEIGSRLKIRVQMILQDANLDEAESFTRFWRDRLAPTDDVVLQKIHNWGAGMDVHDFGGNAELNRYPCTSLFGTCVVDVNGNVVMCCADVGSTVVLGNLQERTIEEIWQSPRLAELRRIHLEGRRAMIPMCDGCSVWREDKHAGEGA